MHKPIISAIAAIGRNRELGADKKLIWDFPTDMKYFRDTVRGHVVVMGRKTFEGVGRPMPGSPNIVMTRQPDWKADGVEVHATISEALDRAREIEPSEIFVIGGGQIYIEAMPWIDKLYLTLIDHDYPQADAFFPPYEKFKQVVKSWEVVENGVKLEFRELSK